MFELEPALRRVIEMEGSDLHLKVPSNPLIRRHGRLEPIPGSDPLTPEDTETVLAKLLGGEHPRTLDEVGRTFNVTRERIRQIENQSLKKLQSLAEAQKLRDVA